MSKKSLQTLNVYAIGCEKAWKWQLRDRRHQNKAMVKGLGRKSSYLAALSFFFFFFF